MACGHGGDKDCQICKQEKILGQGRQKRQYQSRTPGRRPGSKPPPKAGEGKKKR